LSVAAVIAIAKKVLEKQQKCFLYAFLAHKIKNRKKKNFSI
jgi:hypothetical protein